MNNYSKIESARGQKQIKFRTLTHFLLDTVGSVYNIKMSQYGYYPIMVYCSDLYYHGVLFTLVLHVTPHLIPNDSLQ